MKRDKFQITVNGWVKLLATIVFFLLAVRVIEEGGDDYNSDGGLAAGISMMVYSLLFVYLALKGTESKIAQWIADSDIFSKIFLLPTIICTFYSGAIYFSEPCRLSAFGALLTILSIPLCFVLLGMQGGIRRWSGMAAFVALPFSLYVFGIAFPEKMLAVAGSASILVVLLFIVIATIEYGRDHKADYSSADDKSVNRNYEAKWDGRPDSEVKNNVIYLRGTIIVEYRGELFQDKADLEAYNLINQYAMRVKKEMPGYSIGDPKVKIEYRRVG